MTLPRALLPLLKYRNWITWSLEGTDKKPCDWRTGHVADAQDPDNWTDYDTAYGCPTNPDHRVGFVFTEASGFWFLDIDHCLHGNVWSPLAIELCAALQGCAVEVSQSGTGLHLIGRGIVPPHNCRGPAGSGLELYTSGRFMALGARGGSEGCADTDCTDGIALVVGKWFSKNSPILAPTISQGPVPEWRGPTDDEDLIRRLKQSKSSAVFAGKASAAQLWDGDTVALQAAFPAEGRVYDASSADAALASHLAFWTGKDAPRMLTIMRKSRLAREKWDREDYLPRTIGAACLACKTVCVDKDKLAGDGLLPGAYLDVDEQKLYFHNFCYIMDINKVVMPGGHMAKQEQLDNMLGGISYVMDLHNQKVTTSAWEALTKSRALAHDKAHTSSFRPDKKTGEVWIEGNERHVNTYWPIPVDCRRGNPKPFIDHMVKLFPDDRDRDIILAYMAAIVQHRGVKFQWAPLIQGARGNGKTLLSRCVIEAIGRKHCHIPMTSEITDKFNDWRENKIFIAVEDIYIPSERRELVELLKPMITLDWAEIQGKGQDKRARRVCDNYILNSNHKDAITTYRGDRGLCVFYTAQQDLDDLAQAGMLGGEYFPKLYSWLRREGYAVVTDYLQHYKIPDELNPTRGADRAPLTTSTAEAIRESQGTLEQEIDAACLCDQPGFRNGWISTHMLDALIRSLGQGAKIARNKRRKILLDMGYVSHPGVERGQAVTAVQPDGSKPVLYVKRWHYSMGLTGVAVGQAYSADQTATGPFVRAVATQANQ